MSDDGLGFALLEDKLGHTFVSPTLLETALTHKSFANENPQLGRPHNERFEFLGDAVIDLVVGHMLMEWRPEVGEGDLSKLRAQLVSESGLYEVATALGLGDWVFLGKGEEANGGRRRASLLADAFEAVIAAVYLDGGFGAAEACVRSLFGERVQRLDVGGATDFKTRLQEMAARQRFSVRYQVVAAEGPDHDKVFEVAVFVSDVERGRALGRNKKEAEQRAAEAAVGALGSENVAAPANAVVDPDAEGN